MPHGSLNKAYSEWKGLSLPTRPETVTLLPVEAVKEMNALTEKKGHKEEEEETEPEPKPPPCPSAVDCDVSKFQAEQELKPESVLTQRRPKPVLPPRRTSTRATKINEEAPTGEGALKELARLGGDALNPEAQTLAERLHEGVELAEFASASVAALTFTMMDRFGGDIG